MSSFEVMTKERRAKKSLFKLIGVDGELLRDKLEVEEACI